MHSIIQFLYIYFLKKISSVPPIPFFKIFAPFVLGLALQQLLFINYNGYAHWLIIIIAIVALALSALFKTYNRYKAWWLPGSLVWLAIIAFGFGLSSIQQKTKHKNHYSNFIKDSSILRATILQPLVKKTKSYKTTLAISEVHNNNVHTKVSGEALCYFTQTTTTPKLLPGSQILLSTKLLPIKNNGNPGEFDYVAYCNRKDILHSCFANTFSYVATNHRLNNITTLSANWRIATISVLKKYIKKPAAFGIAEALLIGDRTDIDQETWDSYSRTGIVHIIAISGMHMGIIYIGILALLGIIPWFKKNNIVAIIIAVTCMWIFACVTGLPASVMRAAVMFTILAIGSILNRDSNGYNALLVSAFILLCYNTRWLQDVGFQLSYAAVLGIMLFAKPIQNLLYVKNKAGLALWKLISGTLAAQIFTFPLCLYYFHQFPLIFLISNIIAIPLTSVILYAEIVLLCTTLISDGLSMLLGNLISSLILCLNKAIHWLSTFTHVTIYNVHCNLWQTLLLFAFVCCGIYAVRKRNYYLSILGLLCIVAFYGIQLNTFIKAQKQAKLIVYNVPKKNMVACLKGQAHQLISVDSIKASDVKNAVEPSLITYTAPNAAIDLCATIQADSIYLYTQIGLTNCLILGKHADSIMHQLPCKYVILTHNTKAPLAEIATQCAPQCIIADGSNSMWKIEQWQTEAKDLHLQFFSTQQQGAFEANL